MLKVALLGAVARRLARTRFGQRALTQPDRPAILKQKPTNRVYGGLALMALSALTGLPALAALTYLSVRMGKPMIIAAGGPVAFALVHIIFGLGVYLAGRNYAIEALLWVTRRFLEKHA
jgi:hypothetical protein